MKKGMEEKLLKEWKFRFVLMDEIIRRLNILGISVNKREISKIFYKIIRNDEVRDFFFEDYLDSFISEQILLDFDELNHLKSFSPIKYLKILNSEWKKNGKYLVEFLERVENLLLKEKEEVNRTVT